MTVFICTTILVAGLFITILLSLCMVNTGKNANKCGDEIDLKQTFTDVTEETVDLQPICKETDQCIDEVNIHQTSADVFKESVSLQPVIEEHEIDLKYVKDRKVQNRLISTKAFDMIYETVRANTVTIISGPPGCGKTSLCYQAAFKLRETYNFVIVVVSNSFNLIESLKANTKQVILIDDIVGKYSLNDNSLQMWGNEANFINHFLGQNLDTKLIITCRSYIYRNEKFSLFQLSHKHCDMLADEMVMTKDERQQICKFYVPEEETLLIPDSVLMLYNCFPLICSHYKIRFQKNIKDYFTYPYDIMETTLNELRLSSDPCFIALGLLVIFNNIIDKHFLKLHDNKQKTEVDITDVLNDLLQDIDFRYSISLETIISSLSYMENTYIKETTLTFTCISQPMFNMLARIVGRHFIPCILKHSNSEFIKDHIEVAPFSKEHELHTIRIGQKYEQLYFDRILDDINKGRNWEVFSSVQMEHTDRRSLLIDLMKTEKLNFCKSKNDGATALHVTSFFGYHDLSVVLVANDISMVNTRDNTGKTPLHMACQKGNVIIAKLLIKSDAKVNQLDTYKVTPFMLACASGNTELIKFLFTKQVHINEINSFGYSPLLSACNNKNIEVVSLLLQNKAYANCFNKDGDTPLHLACQSGHTEIVKILIQYETVKNKQNLKGLKPLDLALKNGYKEIADLIQNNNATIC